MRQALELALEALEGMQNAIYNIGGEHVIDLNYAVEKADVAEQAITAIKEALAQPEQPKVRTGDCLLVGVCASEGHKIQKAQPKQEPVAWMSKDEHEVYTSKQVDGYFQHDHIPLYTTPQQRTWVGLTDDEIAELWLDIYGSTPSSGIHEDGLLPWRLVRAIEAAHGIKE